MLPTFDLSHLVTVAYAAQSLGPEKCATIQTIKISFIETHEATCLIDHGAVRSNGDKHHYAMDVFPSLTRLEVEESRGHEFYQDWDWDLLVMRNVIRYCFAVPVVEVEVSLFW
jgi:hypothetical protein